MIISILKTRSLLSQGLTEKCHNTNGGRNPPSTPAWSEQTALNSWKLPDADELQQMTQYVTESMRLQTTTPAHTLIHTQLSYA